MVKLIFCQPIGKAGPVDKGKQLMQIGTVQAGFLLQALLRGLQDILAGTGMRAAGIGPQSAAVVFV